MTTSSQMNRRNPETAATVQVAVPIFGLSLGGCGAEEVERSVRSLPGVSDVYVNRANDVAYITYESSRVSPSELRCQVEVVGLRVGTSDSWRVLRP